METGGNSLPSGADGKKRKVSYYYDPLIGNYHYGSGHSMKPLRIAMTHDLLLKYRVLDNMQVFKPIKATSHDLLQFHSDEYISFLKRITPDNAKELAGLCKIYYVNSNDCPVFDGLYDYCTSYTGGSLSAAARLNEGSSDIAINWSGGLHHAKCSAASGFCYVNDAVLAITELLKHRQRVLYVDIDVHHGDGVEEAFYQTDRVMTVSFHQRCIFPYDTGLINHIGSDQGKYHAVNVPLDEGITDHTYHSLFKPIISKVMEVYRPEALVLQCGADSLARDPLGSFNLTIKGHAECVNFIRSFNLPLLLLGGGGYCLRNVPRCWAYETAVAVGVELQNDLPSNEFYAYFGPHYTLHDPPIKALENKNSTNSLEKIKTRVLDNISKLEHAPSVQFQERPPDASVDVQLFSLN
ncbi:histone deacetylase 19-like [Dioscorea cayenensis subsp. rotundata]|uniref:Histone deacetylase n=1 Tax=Dioscorea cayennensis subsp. rotundata TaxID=55577 RepID=A0AB40B7R5_DIOCR|nr:histone deacetylase 19-like [Dioscorea cayenensis subsp. rotundata]